MARVKVKGNSQVRYLL